VGALLRPGCGGLQAPSFSATSSERAASQAERNRAQQHGDVRSCFCRAAMAARAQQHGGVRFWLQIYNGCMMRRPFPNENKYPFGCNAYVTAVAAGQSQRFYCFCGVEILNL
jgi:hypothetical protein